jgi:hypothetical protein
MSAGAPGDFRVWPVATNFSLGPDVIFRGEAEVGRAAEPAASVENDPTETWRALCFWRSYRASGLQGRGGQEKGHVWFVRYVSACLWLIDTLAP